MAPGDPMSTEGARHGRAKLVMAFAAVYLIWGSTYIAIRFAVETLPPFLMAGTRSLMAGSLLYAWARAHGAQRPSRSHWAAASIVGAILLLAATGRGFGLP